MINSPRNRRTKVALFLPNLRGGGAERVNVNLARGLSDRGIAADMVLGRAEGAFLSQVPADVRIVDLHARGMKTAIVPLARYLRTERPATLLAALDHANVCALLAKRISFTPTRLVIAIHSVRSRAGVDNASWKVRVKRFLMRRVYHWADAAVAVSRGAGEEACRINGIPLDRLHVIYNPTISPELHAMAAEEPDHPWFAPGQPKVILAVGSLIPVKDFATLIRAFALYRKNHVARLMILGEGAQRMHLEGLVRDLGLTDDISLPGFANNPYAIMSKAALVVVSSRWESLSAVLIEALALGVPVVSTDCDFGPREILAGGRYGKLTPVGDVPLLADAMERALSGPRPVVPPEALHPFQIDTAVEKYLDVLLNSTGTSDKCEDFISKSMRC